MWDVMLSARGIFCKKGLVYKLVKVTILPVTTWKKFTSVYAQNVLISKLQFLSLAISFHMENFRFSFNLLLSEVNELENLLIFPAEHINNWRYDYFGRL